MSGPPGPRGGGPLGWIEAACTALAGAAMVALVGVMGWLVFGRYVLNDTPTWVEQLSLLLVVWITFLGAAVGVRRGAHLSVDLAREALPPRPRAAARVAAEAAVAGFGALMAWQGVTLARRGLGREVPMLEVSEAWRSAPLAICGALVTLFAGARIVALLRGEGPHGPAPRREGLSPASRRARG